MSKHAVKKTTYSRKNIDTPGPIQDLQSLGFSEYEAWTYMGGLSKNPATS